MFGKKKLKKPKRKPTKEIGDRTHLVENSRRIHHRDWNFGLSQVLKRLSEHDPHLIEVNLTGFKHIVADDLVSALEGNPYIQSLSLQACGLSDEGTSGVFSQLHCLPNLAILDLAGNGISDAGVQAFCRHSHRTLPKLKELNLSWNRISCDGASALGAALKNNKNRWTSLDLSGVTLSRGGGRDAGLGVDRSNRQTIGDVGLSALCEGLRGNSTLLRLLLNRHDEDITHEGIAILAETLRNHPLQHLELNRTRIDDCSMMALARVLPLSSLLYLDVTINSVTIASIRVLAKALMVHNPPLQTLLLTNNCMDIVALRCLEEAARYNTMLMKVEVYGHEAGKEGSGVVWRIRPWLRQNRTLQSLLVNQQLGTIPYFMASVGNQPDVTRLFRFVQETPHMFRIS